MQVLLIALRGALILSFVFAAALASTTWTKAQSNLPAGHHWSYVFEDDTVLLTVSVGTWDTKAMRFIQIYRTDGYKFPCSETNSQFVCNMNIKEKILESYQKAGLNGVVGDSESYAGIEVEATGIWNNLVLSQQPSTLAHHSTVTYSFQTPSNNSVIFRGFSPSDPKYDNVAWSSSFVPQAGMKYQMAATLVQQGQQNQSFQKFGIEFDKQSVYLGQVAHNGAPTFELTANQLVLSPVDGFQLSSFSVDPKMGSGG